MKLFEVISKLNEKWKSYPLDCLEFTPPPGVWSFAESFYRYATKHVHIFMANPYSRVPIYYRMYKFQMDVQKYKT